MKLEQEANELKQTFNFLVKQYRKAEKKLIEGDTTDITLRQHYDNLSIKLSNFMAEYGKFIRSRKNSYGVFSEDDYVEYQYRRQNVNAYIHSQKYLSDKTTIQDNMAEKKTKRFSRSDVFGDYFDKMSSHMPNTLDASDNVGTFVRNSYKTGHGTNPVYNEMYDDKSLGMLPNTIKQRELNNYKINQRDGTPVFYSRSEVKDAPVSYQIDPAQSSLYKKPTFTKPLDYAVSIPRSMVIDQQFSNTQFTGNKDVIGSGCTPHNSLYRNQKKYVVSNRVGTKMSLEQAKLARSVSETTPPCGVYDAPMPSSYNTYNASKYTSYPRSANIYESNHKNLTQSSLFTPPLIRPHAYATKGPYSPCDYKTMPMRPANQLLRLSNGTSPGIGQPKISVRPKVVQKGFAQPSCQLNGLFSHPQKHTLNDYRGNMEHKKMQWNISSSLEAIDTSAHSKYNHMDESHDYDIYRDTNSENNCRINDVIQNAGYDGKLDLETEKDLYEMCDSVVNKVLSLSSQLALNNSKNAICEDDIKLVFKTAFGVDNID